MDWLEFARTRLGWLPPRWASWLEGRLRSIPAIQEEIEDQYDVLLSDLEDAVKPYRKRVPSHERIPELGMEREQIIGEIEALGELEQSRWADGYVSGAVYHGDPEHIAFLNEVYALQSQSNPLHSDLWPSTTKFEAEIVSMTAQMLGGGEIGIQHAQPPICGTVTSGGTESILLAMKAYRDWGREVKGIKNAEMVVPSSAHAAFEKAAQYFNIRLTRIPVGSDWRADVDKTRSSLSRNTVVVVGSAPSFPHGVIDPIAELSELAYERGIGFHTDACLGGFLLPWAERLGYAVPPFDFRLPGVTSISADTHKYGYAAKGTSVVLYRRPEMRRYQYYATADWPGGLYFSPTFAGSRPGALSAACWAAMLVMGEQGYLQATKRILETAEQIKRGIEAIPELQVLGDPLWVIAFRSETLNIYQVMDRMTSKGWILNGLQNPPAVHLCVTMRQTQPEVAQRFIQDLQDAVIQVKNQPEVQGGMAPVYGMAASIPFRGMVSEMLKRYLDLLYKV